MSNSAFLYFPTPSEGEIELFLETIKSSGIDISHFGRRDPPKKWQGGTPEMVKEIIYQKELNKYAFIRDVNRHIHITLQIFYDPRWEHSTLSLSLPDRVECHAIAKVLSLKINPYLCIQENSVAGAKQKWLFLHKRNDCPQQLIEQVMASQEQ